MTHNHRYYHMKTCVKCTINWGSIYNSIKLVKSEVNFWFCMILTEFIDYTRALFDFAGSRVFSSILHVRYMLTCKIMAARDFDNLGLEQHSPIHSTSLSSLLFSNLELHFKWTILWRSIFVAVLFTWIFFFCSGSWFYAHTAYLLASETKLLVQYLFGVPLSLQMSVQNQLQHPSLGTQMGTSHAAMLSKDQMMLP
jgi:hypothetical protein